MCDSKQCLYLNNRYSEYKECGNSNETPPRSSQLIVQTPSSFGSMCSSTQEIMKTGECEDTKPLFEELLGYRNGMMEMDETQQLAIFNNLGIVNMKLRRYKPALECFARVLHITQKWIGPRLAHAADILDNMGFVNVAMFDYHIAIQRFQAAKRIRLEHLGLNHPKLAESEGNLGETYFTMGDFKQAIVHFQQGINIFNTYFGRPHLSTAQMMEDLACAHDSLGDYEQALDLFHNVLGMKTSLKGHQDRIADTLHNIAVTLGKMGYPDLAIGFFQQAREIYERGGFKDTEKLANTLKNIGILSSQQRNFPDAISFLRRALSIETCKFGLNSLNVAETLNSLGVAYVRVGNHKPAIRLYQIALRSARGLHGRERIQVADIHHNLGVALMGRGSQHRLNARQHFEESFRIFCQELGELHTKSQTAKRLRDSLSGQTVKRRKRRRNLRGKRRNLRNH